MKPIPFRHPKDYTYLRRQLAEARRRLAHVERLLGTIVTRKVDLAAPGGGPDIDSIFTERGPR